MEQIKIYSDQELKELWGRLKDIPVNWDDNGTELVAIPDIPESTEEPCLDEDFHIWKRGVTVQEVWEWFDERHSIGLYALMYPADKER